MGRGALTLYTECTDKYVCPAYGLSCRLDMSVRMGVCGKPPPSPQTSTRRVLYFCKKLKQASGECEDSLLFQKCFLIVSNHSNKWMTCLEQVTVPVVPVWEPQHHGHHE